MRIIVALIPGDAGCGSASEVLSLVLSNFSIAPKLVLTVKLFYVLPRFQSPQISQLDNFD